MKTANKSGGRNLPSRTLVLMTCLTLLGACTTYVQQAPPPPKVVYQAPVVYAPAPQDVVSVYVDPPIAQPAPIAVQWAPPPLLVEVPPAMPFEGAVWVGGYWHWEGAWVWARGRWLAPPRPLYAWVQPYYENRAGTVVFITGHWSPPGVAFVPPPPNLNISLAVISAGVVPGPAPIGPSGVFIPAPPGSRAGLIVPAPIGTPPAVVTSAPPVVNVGMRVTAANTINSNNQVSSSSTTINNVTNITRVTNVTNVTIVAPATATASGKPVNATVPGQAHLAAALPPAVRAYAPEPVSARAIAAGAANRAPAALPPAQPVRAAAPLQSQAAATAAAAPGQHPAAAAASMAPGGANAAPPGRGDTAAVQQGSRAVLELQTRGPGASAQIERSQAAADTSSVPDRQATGRQSARTEKIVDDQRGRHEAARPAQVVRERAPAAKAERKRADTAKRDVRHDEVERERRNRAER